MSGYSHRLPELILWISVSSFLETIKFNNQATYGPRREKTCLRGFRQL